MSAYSRYTWNDPYKRVLKHEAFVGDNAGTVTVSYVPNVVGDPNRAVYLAWVAEGNRAIPYRPAGQGYGSVAEARLTRIAKLKDEVVEHIHDNYEYDILRNQFDDFFLSGENHDAIRRVFAAAEAAITAINGSSSITAIRDADLDLVNHTHQLGA